MERDTGAQGGVHGSSRAGANDGDGERRVSLSTSTVEITTTPNHVNVSIAGELDMGDADRVGAILRDAAAAGRALLRVDLAGLTFADSSAIKAILVGAGTAEQRGVAYQLVNPHGGVRRLLEVTGLTEALEVIDEPLVQEGPNSL
jgi:anti-sigma B factor antagonist